MKATGIVRKVDDLGRIVLPVEVRKELDIEGHDSLEVYTDGNSIVLQKYNPCCVFCRNSEPDMMEYMGKLLCSKCRSVVSTAS